MRVLEFKKIKITQRHTKNEQLNALSSTSHTTHLPGRHMTVIVNVSTLGPTVCGRVVELN